MNIKVLYTAVILSLAGTHVFAGAAQPLILDSPELKTEMWLQLQREGNSASKKVQTATPAERELAMQRLLDSYKHPIPEYYGEADGGKFKR